MTDPDVATKPENRQRELMLSDCRDAVQTLIETRGQERAPVIDYVVKDLMLSVQAQCRVLGVRLIDPPTEPEDTFEIPPVPPRKERNKPGWRKA